MKKVFYVIMAVTISIAVVLVMRQRPLAVESIKISRGSFEETLSAEGKIRALHRQTIYSQATGDIGNLSIKLGDVVHQGQSVGRVDWDKVSSVKIPIDGVITKIFRDSAGPVTRGEPLFEVSSLKGLEVVVELLTPEAVRLSLGTEALIRNWGGAEDLQGKVARVSRAGAVKTSALGVDEERTEVQIQLEKIPAELEAKLGDNYHVDVVFRISKEENVLTLPLGALFKKSDKWAVYLIQDERAKLREIEVGKKNDRQLVVLNGLTEGDQVILFPGDKVIEGTKVK